MRNYPCWCAIQMLGVLVSAVAFIGLAGYVAGVPALSSWRSGEAVMALPTMVSLLAIGAALFLIGEKLQRK